METVLTAFIVIFVAIFAISSYAHVTVDTHAELSQAHVTQQARAIEQQQTVVHVANSRFTDDGAVLEVSLVNSGSLRLSDYADWDVIVNYKPDGGVPGIRWLDYNATDIANAWRVQQIYLSEQRGLGEAYEPQILNPGETAILALALGESVERGTTLHASITTPTGIGTTLFVHRNALPVLVNNMPVRVGIGGTVVIDAAHLMAEDPDNLPPSIIFEAISPPAFGSLAPGNVFSQAQIDDGKLQYTHTGATNGSDAFVFNVMDGEDTVGSYSFAVEISAAPMLLTNTEMILNVGDSGIFNAAHLDVSDIDDAPEAVTFVILESPTQGTLSPVGSFTQADLNSGLVSYNHTGTGSDSFVFTVTDGVNTIGPFTFDVTIN